MPDLNRSFVGASARSGSSSGSGGGYSYFKAPRSTEAGLPPAASTDSRPVVLGLTDETMSPAVREAFDRLLQEFDRLRREVDRRREHEGYLRALVDRHPIVPVLSRRALFREINRAIERDHTEGNANTFVVLSLVNATGVRLVHGEAAARSLLIQVGETLVGAVRASDVVGVLGGFDFGVLLTLASDDAAERKAKSLVSTVADQGFVRTGTKLALDVAWGLRGITSEDTADEIVSAADRDLRDRLAMAARYAANSETRHE